jgi:hypothetical protein
MEYTHQVAKPSLMNEYLEHKPEMTVKTNIPYGRLHYGTGV